MSHISVFRVRVVLAVSFAALAFAAATAKPARAQYGGDPYRTYTDQMVIDHMNQRRMEERIKERNKHSTKHSGKSAARNTGSSKVLPKAKAAAAAKPVGVLQMSQDMYSEFGNDIKGNWTLVARLTPQNGGAALVQALPLRGERSVQMENVPPGRYLLTLSRQNPGGGTEPVQVGKECGEPSNPNGGKWDASLPITMVLKTVYGRPIVEQPPHSIWFRP